MADNNREKSPFSQQLGPEIAVSGTDSRQTVVQSQQDKDGDFAISQVLSDLSAAPKSCPDREQTIHVSNPIPADVPHIEEYVKSWIERVLKAAQEGGNIHEINLMSVAERAVIYADKIYPEPEVLLYADDQPVFCRGDISGIVGLPGARKSWLCKLIGALCLSGGHSPRTTQFSTSKPLTVLWIDTEQGEARTAAIRRTLARMVNDHAAMQRLTILSMRDFDAPTRLLCTALFIVKVRPDVVIIDGISDLMNDPNSIPETAVIREFLLQASSLYQTHICSVIHANIGNAEGKPRGHLGSEIFRKAATMLNITDHGDGVSNCVWKKTRDKAPEPFGLQVADSLPEVVGIKKAPTTAAQAIGRYEKARSICRTAGRGVTHTELFNQLMKTTGKGTSTTKTDIKSSVELGFLCRENGLYYPGGDRKQGGELDLGQF